MSLNSIALSGFRRTIVGTRLITENATPQLRMAGTSDDSMSHDVGSLGKVCEVLCRVCWGPLGVDDTKMNDPVFRKWTWIGP